MTLIGPNNEVVKNKSLKKLSSITGLSYASIASLSAGRRFNLNGWIRISGRDKKKAKEFIARHTLINLKTNERVFVWINLKSFAKERELSYLRLHRLIEGSRTMYKDWITKKTFDLLYDNLPEKNF